MIITQNVSQRIPEELRELRRWIVHREKKPWDVTANRPFAGWQKPDAWMSFDEAVALVEGGQADGLGFVFARNDTPFVGIDLDKCILMADDEPTANACAAAMMELFLNAYWEYSPSGKGLHCILTAAPSAWEGVTKLKAANFEGCENVEIFANAGYLTFTGDTWQEDITFEDYTAELAELIRVLSNHKRRGQVKPTSPPPNGQKRPTAPHRGRLSPYARRAFDEEVQAVARAIEGKRNDTLNRAAFSLGQLVAGGELDAGEVEAALLTAARQAGLTEQEARATIKSGMQAGAREPRTAPQLNGHRPTQPGPRQYLAGAGRKMKVSRGEVTLEDLSEAYPRHEVGDAELLARIYKGRAVYDHSERAWYFWTGHYWQRDKEGRAYKMANAVAAAYLRAAAAAREDDNRDREAAFTKRASRLRFKSRIRNILELAAADLGVSGDIWDAQPDKLAVQNGVLNLRTGELESGRPEDYIRTVAPVTWQGLDAPAPRWERFLLEIFDNDWELVAFMQRLLGYGITGHRREAVLPILWGEGRNGKDTLLETLAHVMGDMAAPVSSAVLIRDKYTRASAATPHLTALRYLRLAWVNETREGEKLDAGQVKHLTGGGRITARALYAEPITFEPQHLLMLITNKRPRADADDYALWKRLLLIPFTLSFVDSPTRPHERQREEGLLGVLKGEAPGVLAWLVRGAMAWYREGLRPPESVRLATEAYREEEDTVGQFIAEACVEGAEMTVKASELYRAYVTWAESYGLKAMSQQAFGRRVSKRFSKEKTRQGLVYRSLGLLAKEGL